MFNPIPKPIKTKRKNKNTKRFVSEKTKLEVYNRDEGKCVCCGSSYQLERTPHHCYWGFEANRGENRNDADQLVTICMADHRHVHFEGDSKGYRQKCKDYLKLHS